MTGPGESRYSPFILQQRYQLIAGRSLPGEGTDSLTGFPTVSPQSRHLNQAYFAVWMWTKYIHELLSDRICCKTRSWCESAVSITD
jgi:hypothetical protein